MHAVFQALLQLAKIVMSVEVDAWGVVSDEGLAKGAGKGCYEGVCCLTAVCGYDVGVGSMAERPNALVLKTSDGKPSGGSNPSTSAVSISPREPCCPLLGTSLISEGLLKLLGVQRGVCIQNYTAVLDRQSPINNFPRLSRL